ncbi:uncharacterized protein [Amphiura filiformis]|uniref:uncharacterized protein n=1 Tax=Amphiura filiformis TaxID=82378 RepID=UPI003B216C41
MSADEHLSETTRKATRSEGSFCDQLWEDTKSLREEALNSKWIQGIGQGTLDPKDYGGYMVQDSIYCASVVENLGIAKKKADPGSDIFIYLEAQEKYISSYRDEMFKDWHIKSKDGIYVNPQLQLYMNYTQSVATTMDPLYFLISLVPGYRIFYWLAIELGPGSAANNLYQFWIDTMKTHKGWQRLQKLIDAHEEAIKEDTAKEVYNKCMQGEVNFFKNC